MMLLKGKSVVITGAGSGVGRASARVFAAAGASVICADINAEWIEETVKLVTAQGGRAVAQTCDVRVEAEVETAVAQAVANFGRLDVMFANAGVSATFGTPLLAEEVDEVTLDRVLDVNVRGAYYCCRASVRQFKRQDDGQGAIVITGSVAGMVGWGNVIYGSTKGAANQMARSLAIELAPSGVRVNAVCPGAMNTRYGLPGAGEPSEERARLFDTLHPLGRAIEPEDIANAAMFLSSDLARNITGVCLPVDGGYVAR